MFLALWRCWANHYVARHCSRVDAISSAEKGDHRWPEAPTHEGIDLRQALALKLADDPSPTLFGLR